MIGSRVLMQSSGVARAKYDGGSFLQIFIDESGNSGADIYDVSQPIYATAAVWVDDTAHADVVSLVEDVKARERIQLPELKGARLIKSSPGRRALTGLVEGCLDIGVEISLAVQHKAFMAASVVVEDCTDHVYNKHFGPEWTWDTRPKEPLAARIMELVDAQVLTAWWRARRSESLSDFAAAHAKLLEAMALHSELAEYARKFADTDLNGGWEPKHVRNELPTGGYSPNSIMFPPMLMGLDAMAEERALTDIEIVHDEQNEFEDGYSFYLDIYKNSDPFDVTLPNGNRMKAPLKKLESIRFVRSENEVGVQLADCFAVLAKAVVQDRTPGAPRLLDDPARFAGLMSRINDGTSGREFPWVVGPLGWQVDAMKALLGMN